MVLPASLPGLDQSAGLRNALGRPAFYAEVLQRFAVHYADGAQRMAQALAEARLDILLREAHTLRGLAGDLRLRLASVAGVTDLQIEKQVLIPQIKIRLDYEQVARYGVAPGTLLRSRKSRAG